MNKQRLSKNNKKVVMLLSFAIVVVLSIIFAFGFRLNNKIKYEFDENIKEINISLERIEKVFLDNITNRCIKNIEDKMIVR